jgi:aspartate 1-decarboxylase
MTKTLLSGKIHRAVVTQAELDYVGSITIDKTLADAAGFSEYEQVHIVNVDNGNRIVTYVIFGDPDSGTICLNGAAAHLFNPGEKIIIMAYQQFDEVEASTHKPKVVFVDESNKTTKITHYEKHGQLG